MICEQGDVVELNFNPSHSHEPAGRHYGVVVSPWEINSMSALTVIAPVTSQDNRYPLHVPIARENCIAGFVQCEAIMAIDLNSRAIKGTAKVVGALDEGTMKRVMSRVLVVLGLE